MPTFALQGHRQVAMQTLQSLILTQPISKPPFIMVDIITDTTSRARSAAIDETRIRDSSPTHELAVVNEGDSTTSDGGTEKGIVPGTDDFQETEPPPRTAHGFVWLLIITSKLMANFLFH